jgi:pilus assembly protein CpaE
MSVSRDGKKIRVLIVDDIQETRDNLKKLLYFEDDIEIIGAASNGREGIEQAAALHPDIVLMDINMPGMDGIQASELISQQDPNIQVVMMSVQGEADYLRRSMLAGAREFLIKPFSSEELANSLRRVHQLAATRRAMAPAPAPTAPPSDANFPTYAPRRPQVGKVIALYSPKGGVGVSTVAVNLALALKSETHARVALVDTSLQFGDVGVLLNLPTSRTLADIAEAKNEPDEDLLNGILATHSSGVKVLVAPPQPETAELITPEHLRATLTLMQKMFDYIVVDTGKSISDPLLAVFDLAEQIILISTTDISALKDAKLFFEVTQKLEYPPSKTLLILNRYENKTGIHARDIESNIKHPVTGVIPRDDKATTLALTRGIPVVLTQRGIPFSQALFGMARMLKRDEEPMPTPVAPPAKTAGTSAPASPKKIEDKPKRRFLIFGRSS